MNTRFFAFGCSYTNFHGPTWADYVGVNFDEYCNFGVGGASNTFIMNRLVEADHHYNFNSSDTVIVMLTGFNRFSWISKHTPLVEWNTNGDLTTWIESEDAIKNRPYVKSFVDNMWSNRTAVYMSWIATKTIKSILSLKNVNYKILMSLDNSHYTNKNSLPDLDERTCMLAKDIYNMLDIKECVNDFRLRKYKNNVGHPSPAEHFAFILEYFPHLITDKSATVGLHPDRTILARNVIYG